MRKKLDKDVGGNEGGRSKFVAKKKLCGPWGVFDHHNHLVRKAIESIHEYTDTQSNQHKTDEGETVVCHR